MATVSMIERKPTLRPPMYNRPRKRRPDQIPLRWVSSGLSSSSSSSRRLSSSGEIGGTEYKSSFHPLSHERLPPIKQKEELADYRSTDLFEQLSLYKSTFPPIASKRPDFPRPPDQLPKSDSSASLASSTYNKEFIPIPSGHKRPQPTPNRSTWEPEPDPSTLSQPMISLFHNDFKPILLKDKTRSIRHDMGYVLPHYPLENKSASAEAFCWKYQPKGQSFKPKAAVYDENKNDKFEAVSVQRQSYPQYRPEIYAKALLEEDLELDPPNLHYKTRGVRKQRPEGPNLNFLEQSRPPTILAEKVDEMKGHEIKPRHEKELNLADKRDKGEVCFRPETNNEMPRNIGGETVRDKDDGKDGKENMERDKKKEEKRGQEEQQDFIDSYRQSLYHSTYKSDY